jgi:hypothetical protein
MKKTSTKEHGRKATTRRKATPKPKPEIALRYRKPTPTEWHELCEAMPSYADLTRHAECQWVELFKIGMSCKSPTPDGIKPIYFTVEDRHPNAFRALPLLRLISADVKLDRLFEALAAFVPPEE